MKPYFFFIFLSAFFWATADIITRVISQKISSIAVSLGVGIGMCIAMLLAALFTSQSTLGELVLKDKNSFLIAIAAGLVNGIAFYCFSRFFQVDGNFTKGMPIMLLGILIFTVIYGVVFFDDPFSVRIAAGILLAGAAIWLLA